jgi:hypothetical protein
VIGSGKPDEAGQRAQIIDSHLISDADLHGSMANYLEHLACLSPGGFFGLTPSIETLAIGTLCSERGCKWRKSEGGNGERSRIANRVIERVRR